MAIRNSTPILFLPAGTADAVDQTSAFNGACQISSNLIFDRENRGALIARPGVTVDATFAAFAQAMTISVMNVSGTLIYGMISSSRFPGFDEPFCYDTQAKAFITVSNVTMASLPHTQPNVGPWAPPTMDSMGIYVAVTHPGFNNTSNAFGWFDVTNQAAPIWNAGNTGVNALPGVPQWTMQFFGRLYFGIGNAVYFTDALALTISGTNFAAVLLIDDQSATTGVGGLPMGQTSGAVLQSLLVFKQDSVWQISGDISLTSNPLSLSRIVDNVGCIAPRTIQSTPMGVFFIANDGPRVINLAGTVNYLQVMGGTTPDIVAPFATATTPSRMVGCYSNGVYRVCFEGPNNIWDSTFATQEYWYDLLFQRWNGPHSFNYHCAVSVHNSFFLASNNVPGTLFKSSVTPNATTVYQDAGTDITCELVSATIEGLPMTMSAVVESTIEFSGSGDGIVYYISMYDDRNNNLSPATIKLNDVNPLWGTAKWGQFLWRSSVNNSQVFTIPWVNPVVFKKMVLSVRVVAAPNVSIKAAFFRVQTLGYTNA